VLIALTRQYFLNNSPFAWKPKEAQRDHQNDRTQYERQRKGPNTFQSQPFHVMMIQ
jgi:hypothetical protein